MRIVDFRSDTVTVPTEEMRQAMAKAPVGDDVYGEDPTVNALEKEAAFLFQKEAALFVPSGTMGNQLAIMTHCRQGQEVLVDAESHILHYELAAAAILTGVQLYPVSGLHSKDGLEKIDKFIRTEDDHSPGTRLLCLENTHNRNGGTVIDAAFTENLCQKARSCGLKVHVDGARIWNAAVRLDCPPAALVKNADSVMVCLSKGLAAPVGSLLLGSETFIRKARRNRKILGGGMRQVGILAAAGLVALTMRHRLQEDHANARRLAEEIASIPGIHIDLDTVQTNMVLMDVAGTGSDASSFVGLMAKKGIKTSDFGGSMVRLVTHKDVSAADVDYALQVMGDTFA